MGHLILPFLAGATVLSPVMALGLVPSSYQGMTRRPGLAAPYAVTGSIYLLLFPLVGWTAWRCLLSPLGLTDFGLPLLILTFWAVRGLLGIALAWFPAIGAGLPLQLNGCLALGSCLVVIEASPSGLGQAAATSAGMAAGYLVSTLALSMIRERMTRRIPAFLRGWPSLLVLCSLFWLAVKAAGVPLP